MAETTTKAIKVKKSSLALRRVQKFCKNPMAVVAVIVIFLLTMASVCAPLLTPHDPNEINILLRYAEPSAEHILGCDRMGRDLFARVLYGGRWSILIGLMTSCCAHLLGAAMGVIAGYFGRRVDSAIVTFAEFMQLFPTTLVIIMLAALTGKVTIWMLVFLWTITGWTGTMRITRSAVLSLKTEPFVESCVANGIPKTSIMFHHIIPNTTGAIIVNVTMGVAGYILQEAGLSYLGYGLDSSIPTWGNLLNAAKTMDVILGEPIQWIAPGACLLALVLCVNYFGDGLRDALDATTR